MRKFLTEKFDPSMPGWLRKRLLFTANRPSKDVGYQSKDIHPRERRGSNQSEGLYQDFVRKNIDLNNAKFISVDPQSLQKRNDPRLKEPYLPIFHIVGNSGGKDVDTVYAVGINDSDKWPSAVYGDEFADKYFRSIPLKRLLDYTQDFCYLDLTDPTNFLDPQKKIGRQQSLDGLEQRYDVVRNRYSSNLKSRDTGEFIKNPWGDRPKNYSDSDLEKEIDKSGYLKDPNKYASKLKELKARNYSKVLNDLYSRIKTLQTGMIEAFSDYNFKNLQGNISADSFTNFQGLVSSYNKLVTKVNDIVEEYSDDSERFSNAIQRVFDENSWSGSDYKDVITRLRELEKTVADYINVAVDWDVEEENESINRDNIGNFLLDESLFNEDIENLEDVDIITNPVMQDAKNQSEWASKEIKKEMKDIEKDIPEWDSEKVIGASKQPIPDKIKEPKMELDESLFTEARFMGSIYPFEVHWMRPNGNDVLLGGSKSLEGADEIVQDKVEELMDNPFESDKDKLLILQNVYIYNSDTNEVEDVSDETDTFIQRCIQSLYD